MRRFNLQFLLGKCLFSAALECIAPLLFWVFLLHLNSHMITIHPLFWESLVLGRDPNSSAWALFCAAICRKCAPCETSPFLGKLRAATRLHDSGFVSGWLHLTVDSDHMCAGKERKAWSRHFPWRKKGSRQWTIYLRGGHLLSRLCWNECQECHFNNPFKSLKLIYCEFIAKLKIQGKEPLLHACIYNSSTLLQRKILTGFIANKAKGLICLVSWILLQL